MCVCVCERTASLVELPFSVVQRAHLSGLEPAGDAVEVEGVVADAPGHSALLAGGRGLVRLALYTCTPTTAASICTNLAA